LLDPGDYADMNFFDGTEMDTVDDGLMMPQELQNGEGGSEQLQRGLSVNDHGFMNENSFRAYGGQDASVAGKQALFKLQLRESATMRRRRKNPLQQSASLVSGISRIAIGGLERVSSGIDRLKTIVTPHQREDSRSRKDRKSLRFLRKKSTARDYAVSPEAMPENGMDGSIGGSLGAPLDAIAASPTTSERKLSVEMAVAGSVHQPARRYRILGALDCGF
jgi:hypothetical protein